MAAVLNFRSKFLQGCTIASEFVGHNNPRRAKRLEEFAKKPSSGPSITPRLDEDVQHVTATINGTPQPILLPVNRKNDFVQVPFIRRRWSIPTDHPGILRSEFSNPGTDSLVADHNAARGEQILNIAQTHGKSVIGPHSIGNNLSRETMAFESTRLLGFCHAPTYRLVR